MAVLCPREAGAGFRCEKAKLRIGDYVAPWLRSTYTIAEIRHIFPALVSEPSEPIEKFQRLLRCGKLPVRIFFRGCRSGHSGGGHFLALGAYCLVGERTSPAEQHYPSDARDHRAHLRRHQVASQQVHVAERVVCFRRHSQPSAARELFEGILQVLLVGGRFFVDDNDVRGQPLDAPVFVGSQHLAHDIDLPFIADQHDDDR